MLETSGKDKRGSAALFRGSGAVVPVEDELELLKRKKMLEMQRRMLRQKEVQGKEQKAETRKPSPRELLDRHFGDRAWEVYNAAWSQYPQVMPRVERLLVEAIAAGRISQRIEGEGLYYFFREIGIPVRLQTTIRFKEHGEFKTLTQKMKENK